MKTTRPEAAREQLADIIRQQRAIVDAAIAELQASDVPTFAFEFDAANKAARSARNTSAYRELATRAKEMAIASNIEQAHEWLTQCGIPLKDVPAIVADTLDDTEALAAAHAWVADPDKRILVLAGRPGVGKTTAASWAAARAVTQDWFVGNDQRTDEALLCRRANAGALMLRSTMLARTSWYDADAMRKLEQVGLLVIDDVGAEFCDKAGAFASMLDHLVDSRYAACRPTLMTTNATLTAFTQRYGERLIDRIHECGTFAVCAGPSLRRAQ